MHKRELREERNRQDEIRRKRAVRRNWIVMAVSLGLAFFCYFFLDGIIANVK